MCNSLNSLYKIIWIVFFLCSLPINLLSQNKFRLTDFIHGYGIENSLPEIVPANNSDHFFSINKKQLQQFHFSEPLKAIKSFSLDSLENCYGTFEKLLISSSDNNFLLSYKPEKIYRHSYNARYIILSPGSQNVIALADTAPVRNPTISPCGTKAAWVKNNNIFYQYLNNLQTIAVTTDGQDGEILNGIPDWVYEEELGILSAYAWSGNSRYLAYLKFDEQTVKQYPLIRYNTNTYPVIEAVKYPRAGELNSQVSLWVFDLETNIHTKIAQTGGNWEYIPRFAFTGNNSTLSYILLNRRQNIYQLWLSNAASPGNSQLVYSDSASIFDDFPEKYPLFFNKGHECIVISEKTNFKQAYLLNLKTGKIKSFANSNFDIDQIIFINEAKRKLYCSSHKNGATNVSIACYDLNKARIEDFGPLSGSNKAVFSASGTYCLLEHSSNAQPKTTMLFGVNKNIADTVLNNNHLKQVITNGEIPQKEFFSFKNNDGIELNAWIIKPNNFDPDKKYPVLFYVYGGPGVRTVRNTWQVNWFNYLALEGYIVVSADGKGTPGRGSIFKRQILNKFGTTEVEDQISLATYLLQQNYTDTARIAIYGWSYGGYIAAMCMLKANNIFKAGIAVAPVTDWRMYDNIYTERYMGMPCVNSGAYDSASLLNKAHLLNGRLLLVHGSYDDNVHIQHTMAFANALTTAGKQFEMAIYPDKDHSIRGGNTRLHLYEKMLGFLKD